VVECTTGTGELVTASVTAEETVVAIVVAASTISVATVVAASVKLVATEEEVATGLSSIPGKSRKSGILGCSIF
jgi:hypothetical protein